MSEERTEAPEAPAAGAPWHAGLEGEILGHVQNKGWDKLDAPAAVAAMAQAHREAERRLGVPADQLVRLPTKPDDEGWNAVWERLGAPKEASAYDLAPVKFKDGGELEDGFVSLMRDTAHKLHLSPNGAQDMAKAFVGFMEEAEAREAADAAATAEMEKRKLADNWKTMMEANTFIAKQAIEKVGLSKEFAENLERQVGYADTMETFRRIGMMMQEPGFVTGQRGGSEPPALVSREAAQARLTELQSDPVWFKRFYEGGVAERAEWERVTRKIAGLE